MTIYEKIQELCKRNGFEISNLSNYVPNLKVTKGSISKWKNGATPRANTLKKIADYFKVDLNYFSDSRTTDETNVPVSCSTFCANPIISFKNMSESQRAMFKRHMSDRLMEKYQDESFIPHLCKDLGIDSYQNAELWFKSLNCRILDSRIPDMLKLLSRTEENFFSDMSIVIKKPSTAEQLHLPYNKTSTFPITVDGTFVFPAICKLSLASLSVLDETITMQMSYLDEMPPSTRSVSAYKHDDDKIPPIDE